MESKKTESTIERVGGYLHRMVPMVDSTGKVINYAM